MWVAGSGTSPASARPRWISRRRHPAAVQAARRRAIPHQFSFPKPKALDAAKREAAWAYVRWITDHVAEWTLRAGQVGAPQPHSDPRVTADPVFRALLSQAPNRQNGQPRRSGWRPRT